ASALGSGNVFLGNFAGGGETGSDKLYIDNTSTSTPLIYGDFSSNALTVNGSLRIKDGTQSNGYVLTSDATGNASWQAVSAGDNLGNHTATQNLKLNGKYLSGDGGNEGLYVTNTGNVGVGLNNVDQKLHVAGSAQLMNGGLILTNNYTNSNISQLRRSLIDATFDQAGPDTLQKMSFNVSNGVNSGFNTIMTLTGNGHV
ncbi:MAG: hypothetical protein KDD14_26505, partial [Saprospiraceae bacterium]|nr:hypothetical protein [Saprospiraceae bacterium]